MLEKKFGGKSVECLVRFMEHTQPGQGKCDLGWERDAHTPPKFLY